MNHSRLRERILQSFLIPARRGFQTSDVFALQACCVLFHQRQHFGFVVVQRRPHASQADSSDADNK